MSAIEYRFIEPMDVLFLRGNRLFGDPGSYGESLIPPWPSVAAGAIRSRILADEGVDLATFARGEAPHPALGSPERPGSFVLHGFHLAMRCGEAVEILVAPPADLSIGKTEVGDIEIRTLRPVAPATGLASSAPLPLLPVLPQATRSKPESGYWLKQAGWRKYLDGATPAPEDLVEAADLWGIDPRVGVGLDAATRRAADGRLFSVQAVAMHPDIGFLAAISGAPVPDQGMLRLGGDGRAAAIHPATVALPQPDYEAIAKAGRCRIVLTTPGLFPEGWLLPGTGADHRVTISGVRARLACAAVPRAETVSGWDLALSQPKPAQRVAPTGSVYWLDELDATPDALRKLADTGLWTETGDNAVRRAEGFNRFTFAAY